MYSSSAYLVSFLLSLVVIALNPDMIEGIIFLTFYNSKSSISASVKIHGDFFFVKTFKFKIFPTPQIISFFLLVSSNRFCSVLVGWLAPLLLLPSRTTHSIYTNRTTRADSLVLDACSGGSGDRRIISLMTMKAESAYYSNRYEAPLRILKFVCH